MSPANPKKPTICIVGAGGWGKNHVRTFANLNTCQLVVVCETNATTQQGLRKQYPQVRVVGSYDEILADSGIDAVVLATPAPSHADMAERALRAGKHVFVEKPFALTVAEADRVLAAQPKDRVLMVGHLLLFHPIIIRLKEMIDRGELGDISYLYTQRLNLGVVRRDESTWWSLAPHDISVVLHLLGEEPTDMVAMGACYLQPDVEDVVFACLRFPSERIAKIHVSWLDPHKERKLVVVGSKKMVEFDDMAASEKLKIFDRGADINQDYQNFSEWITIRFGDIVIPGIKLTEPLVTECQHFIDCIVQGKTPLTDGLAGRRVTAVMEKVSKILESNRQAVRR